MQLTWFEGDVAVVGLVVVVTSGVRPRSLLLRLFPDLRPDLRPPFFFFLLLLRYFFIGCSESNSDDVGLLTSATCPSSLWPVSHPAHSDPSPPPPVDGWAISPRGLIGRLLPVIRCRRRRLSSSSSSSSFRLFFLRRDDCTPNVSNASYNWNKRTSKIKSTKPTRLQACSYGGARGSCPIQVFCLLSPIKILFFVPKKINYLPHPPKMWLSRCLNYFITSCGGPSGRRSLIC